MPSVWGELKRRKVVGVAIAYAVVGYAIVEVADLIFPNLGFPDWSVRLAIILVLLGFPLALILSWIFDLSGGQLVRTESQVGNAQSPANLEADQSFPLTAIAVLPFDNLSDEKENAFFADGVAEDILARLSVIPDLHVISRTSVMRYKGSITPVREIASELRVGSVLEGSVRRAGDQVRVVAQLIDTATDKHLWADTFDRSLADIFAVQSDIAENIAKALHAELAPDRLARIRQEPTKNMEAYDLLLLARENMILIMPENVNRAIQQIEQAMELDPEFSSALALLSMAYALKAYYGSGIPRDDFLTAIETANKVLSLDESQANAWMARGFAKYHLHWDWEGAERDLNKAIEIDPNLAEAYVWKGHLYRILLRHEESARSVEKAVSLDPASPVMASLLAGQYFLCGKTTKGLNMLKDISRSSPEFTEVFIYLGWLQGKLGKYADAVKSFERALHQLPDDVLFKGILAMAYDDAGQDLERDRLVEEIDAPDALAQGGPMGQLCAALIRGETDEAVKFAEALAEVRAPTVIHMRYFDLFSKRFADHPGFVALNQRIFGESN